MEQIIKIEYKDLQGELQVELVDKVKSITEDVMNNLNIRADIRTLKPEEHGAEIVSET